MQPIIGRYATLAAFVQSQNLFTASYEAYDNPSSSVKESQTVLGHICLHCFIELSNLIKYSSITADCSNK